MTILKFTGIFVSLFYAVSTTPYATARVGTSTVSRKKKKVVHDKNHSMYPTHEVHLPNRAGRHHEIEAKEQIGVRIVGGTEVDQVGRYPFFVSWGGDCGGSLIHSDIVLTAAHCAGIENGEVVVNAYELDNSALTVVETTAGTEVRNIAQRSIHPNYDDETVANDFLLLKLESPITTIDPISISPKSSAPASGDPLKVIGLGVTTSGGTQPDFLREVEVTAMPDSSCDSKYAQYGGIVPEVMFCAGTPNGGKDSCQGDSGGPIFTYSNSGDAITQVGVVSWGISCADSRYPGVYAEIGAVRDWIDSEICRMSSDKPDGCGGGDDNVDDDVAVGADDDADNNADDDFAVGADDDADNNVDDNLADDNFDDDFSNGVDDNFDDNIDDNFDDDVNAEPPSGNIALVNVNVLTDDFPEEKSWNLFDSTGDIVKEIEEFTYTDTQTWYTSTAQVYIDEEYRFEISDGYGDGICCNHGDGEYEVRVGGALVGSGSVFGESESFTFVVPGSDTASRSSINRPSLCEDSSNSFLIDATVGEQTCDWLADNLGYYDFLCQFLDVAVACPVTCNACDKVRMQN